MMKPQAIQKSTCVQYVADCFTVLLGYKNILKPIEGEGSILGAQIN